MVFKHGDPAGDDGHSGEVMRVSEIWRERISVGGEEGEDALAHQYREDNSGVQHSGDFWALLVERLAVQHNGNASTDS